MKDIFGVTLTMDQVRRHEALLRWQALRDNAIPTARMIVRLGHEFNHDFDVIEYAMAAGRPGSRVTGERVGRFYGESWKDYAIREAGLDPAAERGRLEASIQPQ